MIVALIFLFALVFIIGIMVYDYQFVKEREFELRLRNPDLREYWIEAHSEYNDGWTKLHYLNLYYVTKALREAEEEATKKQLFRQSA